MISAACHMMLILTFFKTKVFCNSVHFSKSNITDLSCKHISPLPIHHRGEMTHTVIRVQLSFHSVLVYEVGWKQGQGLRRRLPCFSSFHSHLSGLRNKATPGAHYHLAKSPREPFKDLEGCLFFFFFFFSPCLSLSLYKFCHSAKTHSLSLPLYIFLSLSNLFFSISFQALFSLFQLLKQYFFFSYPLWKKQVRFINAITETYRTPVNTCRKTCLFESN